MSRSIIRHKNPRGKLTHPSQGQELESAGRFTDQTKNSISSKKCEKVLYVMVIYTTNMQVDDDTVTQLALLHSDIPGYDLPAIDFVSPSEEAQESHILEE